MNEEQLKKDMEVFENDIKNITKQLPHHKVKEFTFTAQEKQMLAEQQTIIVLAGQAQDRIINENCLQRVGIIPNEEVFVRYSIGLGRFVTLVPKAVKKEKVVN